MSRQQPNILILNGPNLNMLGGREPDVYGSETLAAIVQACEDYAAELGFNLECKQTNHEGEMVDIIQNAKDTSAGVIINAGGYTHTSVAIHDALKLLEVPIIEVHLSNIHSREGFRQDSLIAPVVTGRISGFGAGGYLLALQAMDGLLDNTE